MDDNISMPNLDLPDRYYRGTGGYLTDAYECPAGTAEFVVDVSLAGLTYVRDIVYDGMVWAAYGFSDRSPLIGMVYQLTGSSNQPLHPGQRITLDASVTSNGKKNAGVIIRYFFRGGAMESVPYRHLGTVEAWPVSDPSQRLLSPIALGFTVPPVTCTLANASHSLDDVLANELAASGSNAKESSFDVAMNCPMDNIDVQLSLADANDPGSSNGQLAPAPGATAGGVQVQLLRGGQPVQFGQAWSHGWSSKGQQAIPFSARYLRTPDPLVPGDVKGEAVLTADYR
ncbi:MULTISPECIES: fimbrial protein [Stenotrophomonas]|nr:MULTISPECIES: fimbrial protein [Stenotrophomonas]